MNTLKHLRIPSRLLIAAFLLLVLMLLLLVSPGHVAAMRSNRHTPLCAPFITITNLPASAIGALVDSHISLGEP